MAGKETSVVKQLSEDSIFLGEINLLFLLPVHQPSGHCNSFFLHRSPLTWEGFLLIISFPLARVL